jgi:hypothetical protein
MRRRERLFWAVVEPVVGIGVGVFLVACAGSGALKCLRRRLPLTTFVSGF